MFASIFSTLVFSFNLGLAEKTKAEQPNYLKVAQVSITKNPSFEDPRMSHIKKALQANYGGLKPMSISASVSSRNINERILFQKIKEFTFEIGGTPAKSYNDNFIISVKRLDEYGDENSFTEIYTIEFIEESVGVITSHTANVTCGLDSLILNNQKPYTCKLNLNLAEELLLGLTFD